MDHSIMDGQDECSCCDWFVGVSAMSSGQFVRNGVCVCGEGVENK